MEGSHYVGRFAPSPSGPLHYGSLVTALASFLDARHNRGKWLLRIEDLDVLRNSEDASLEIQNQLKEFRLFWDEEVQFQSSETLAYSKAIDQLAENTYLCSCSRKETSPVYRGTCRKYGADKTKSTAIRLKISSEKLSFEDEVFGLLHWEGLKDLGDFIIKRKDGIFAYHLAVVVDDLNQKVTHVVRGSDLLDSTPRQIDIYKKLGFNPPKYCHLPIIVDSAGYKLSKQNFAKRADPKKAVALLRFALKDLGQSIPRTENHQRILEEAIKNWDIRKIPKSLKAVGPTPFI
ncbi:tRNA glutamyl-Q(34) synthetase GluQRS [Gammaproteobacteria bacterium]|nr:tRNA glutamyl-Q(34) synthetase GluQRS [Gammaproteobacteria bacterium]